MILAEDRGNPRLTSSATLDIQVFEEGNWYSDSFPGGIIILCTVLLTDCIADHVYIVSHVLNGK